MALNNSELHAKLWKIHQMAAAHKLSMGVMDAKEFQKRIGAIIADLEDLMKYVKSN